MVFLVPDYLLVSSLIATEAPMLAFLVLGMLLAKRGWSAVGGVAMGLAAVCRPMACFGILGYLLLTLWQKRWRTTGMIVVSCGVVVGLAMLGLYWRLGDPLQSAKVYANSSDAYNGNLLSFPMKWIILTPIKTHVAPLKLALVWSHLILTWTACCIVTRQAIKYRGDHDLLAAPWLLSNTLFIMSLGSIWGFHCLPRFVSPALPPMLWGLRRWLPDRWIYWIPIGAASFVTAVTMFTRR